MEVKEEAEDEKHGNESLSIEYNEEIQVIYWKFMENNALLPIPGIIESKV